MTEEGMALENVVANFLRKNPGFFDQYPDVLEHIEINHGSGGAVSLIERQVEQLRTSKQDLLQRLNTLVDIAAQNEKLLSRLHQLTLKLAPITAYRAFFTQLVERLRRDFEVDAVRIYLRNPEIAAEADGFVAVLDADGPQYEALLPLLEKGDSTCGRFSENKIAFLFGETTTELGSAALVPIGSGARHGIMAFGSHDQGRFYPGMGTLFLDLLADVIDARLSSVAPEEQRRTA